MATEAAHVARKLKPPKRETAQGAPKSGRPLAAGIRSLLECRHRSGCPDEPRQRARRIEEGTQQVVTPDGPRGATQRRRGREEAGWPRRWQTSKGVVDSREPAGFLAGYSGGHPSHAQAAVKPMRGRVPRKTRLSRRQPLGRRSPGGSSFSARVNSPNGETAARRGKP
jgi:hypothetical protein